MAIYRCNSCGATMDTEATARSLGYAPGTKIVFTAPSRCGNCGSSNISEVTSVPQISGSEDGRIWPRRFWLRRIWLRVVALLLYLGVSALTVANFWASYREVSWLFVMVSVLIIAVFIAVILNDIKKAKATGETSRPSGEALGGKSRKERKMAKLDSILATTKSAQWHNPSRVQQMLEPIKNTWGVDCKIIELDEPQVQLIERLHPLDTDFQHINGQYQYQISSNSIFVHPYGSWLNFGYLKFWYSDCIYYVNVAPMVDLTPEFYERSDDLSHMAKIMLALGELDRPDRKSVMIILDGELKQEE